MTDGPVGEWYELTDGSLCYRLEAGIAIVNQKTFEVAVFSGTEGNYRRFHGTRTTLDQAKRLAERRLGVPRDPSGAFDAIVGDSLVDSGTSDA